MKPFIIPISAIYAMIVYFIVANQFKINVVYTGSRQPLYTYGEIQMKLVTQEGINETFTLTRCVALLTRCVALPHQVLRSTSPAPSLSLTRRVTLPNKFRSFPSPGASNFLTPGA
jgi:hypothetical protein